MSAAQDRAQRTVDSIFAEHGVPGVYVAPGGATTPCTVVISDEDRGIQFSGGTSRPFGQGGIFELRSSEIAVPVTKGFIALLDDAGAEISRHVVTGDPKFDDPFRLVWLCTVRPATS